MDVNYLLNKFEPLLPEQTAKWRRALDIGDLKVKQLLEHHIRHAAYKTLGDVRNRLLLSLPPHEKSRGTFHLGTTLYEQPKWDFGLTSKELLQNIAIFGRSGSGKTNVAFSLMQQFVEKRVPFLFLDFKKTARH